MVVDHDEEGQGGLVDGEHSLRGGPFDDAAVQSV